MAMLISISQYVGGAMVMAGLLSRLALLPLAVTVALAAFVFKWKAGFTNGWDWPFVVFASCVTLLLLGSGSYSLDAALGIPFTSSV
jgi:putative oxidoreductase